MEKKLDEFFKENDIRVGKDFTTIPPIYYHSLWEGMYSYFKTISDYKQSITLLLFSDKYKRRDIAFNYNSTEHTTSTILGIHRFFELLLKDILKRINPFLAVKFLENEKQVISYLNGMLIAEDVQTIEFFEAYKRFKTAINFAKENPNNKEYEHILKFQFLIDDETLPILSYWRNRIMHNGNTVPNIFALDYLVTQQILPIVEKILVTEQPYLKNYWPHYFMTPSGINILYSILEIKFHFSELNSDSMSKELRINLLKLAHLKHIASSCFYFDPLILNNKSATAPYCDGPLDRALRIAQGEQADKNFHSIKRCLACGLNTLVTYKKTIQDIFDNMSDKDYFYAKCTCCEYILPENMGDPYDLGLSPVRLFE